MSSSTLKISFRNHNVGANSPDGFRVYRAEGGDPCPTVDEDGLHIPDSANLLHEEMGVKPNNEWVDESDIDGLTTYFYRISFFRNNGVNPNKGAVAHERVDTMLLGPITATSASSLGYPNHFPSNLSGVAYALDVQPLLHLDPAQTVKDAAISHDDSLTSSTGVDYSNRGWVTIQSTPLSSGGGYNHDVRFDLDNILDKNGAPVTCFRFDDVNCGIETIDTGESPGNSIDKFMFLDEGYTVFVVLSPIPNGVAPFDFNVVTGTHVWYPYQSANQSLFGGEIYEWSTGSLVEGDALACFSGSDRDDMLASHANWTNSHTSAYNQYRNANHPPPSTFTNTTRATPGNFCGTPPTFPGTPTSWDSHLHCWTIRLSPITGSTPKYQAWLNGGLENGSSSVHPPTWSPSGTVNADPFAYIYDPLKTGYGANGVHLGGPGAVAEYLLFPKALSNAQMTTVGAYLDNKYALPTPIETFTGAEA